MAQFFFFLFLSLFLVLKMVSSKNNLNPQKIPKISSYQLLHLISIFKSISKHERKLQRRFLHIETETSKNGNIKSMAQFSFAKNRDIKEQSQPTKDKFIFFFPMKFRSFTSITCTTKIPENGNLNSEKQNIHKISRYQH